MRYSFFDKVIGTAMEAAGIKKYAITLMAFMLLTLLCGCAKTEPEFKMDITDASIFDIGEFRDLKRDTLKIKGKEDRIYMSRDETILMGVNCTGLEGRAGFSVTFDLYFTDDDYRILAQPHSTQYRKGDEKKIEWYKRVFEGPLLNAFNGKLFGGGCVLKFGEIDIKQKALKGCTVYGVIYGEDNYKKKDFKIIFDRKNLLSGNNVSEYTKEITFNYDRLTFPNYNNIDDFIASIKNTTVKTSFKYMSTEDFQASLKGISESTMAKTRLNTPYEDLFLNFIPSNPQKGHFMHFFSTNSVSDFDSDDPTVFENDQLHNTLNLHETHLIIYERHINRITSDMVIYRYRGNHQYPSKTTSYITVYDMVSRRIIYNSSDYDRKKIGEEIKALLK